MKRSYSFFVYIFSVALCCLCMLFVNDTFVKAADENGNTFSFECVDRDTNEACYEYTTDGYYVLTEIEVSDSTISELTIPSTHIDTYGTWNVEVINSNVISSSTPLVLDSLILPSNLKELSNNSLTNISSISSLSIPVTVKTIGENIFSNSTVVENVYLNHYDFVDIEADPIAINSNAFSNASITRFICNNFDIYEWYKTNEASTLKSAPLTVVVTYNYYQYENEALTTIYASQDYYIGNSFTSIPSSSEITRITGLNFSGWYLKHEGAYHLLDSEDQVIYDSKNTIYSVYPKYELKEISFDLIATNSAGQNVVEARYDGSEDLLKFSIIDLTHELLTDTDNFVYSFNWAKSTNLTNTISNEDNIYINQVSQSGKYQVTISYQYTYQGCLYSEETTKEISATISKAPLYVVVDDFTKTYGTYLTDDDITYAYQGLVGEDKIDVDNNSVAVTYEYPNSGDIGVGTYANSLRVTVNSIVNNGKEKLSNYSPIYSYGTYVVEPKVIESFVSVDILSTYGEALTISKFHQDIAYGQYVNDVVVYFAKTSGDDVGSYGITGVKNISNNNYVANFNSELTTGKVIINPKKVTTVVSADSNVYNGKAKVLSVYYIDANGTKVDVSYTIYKDDEQVDEIINAGSYVVHIDSLGDSNYDFANEEYQRLSVTIEKAFAIVTYSAYQTFTYTGAKIYPTIAVDNTEQTPVFTCMLGSVQGDYCVNAGSYNVGVKYLESDNYRELDVGTISLSISKYVINLSPKAFTFYYGEDIKTEEELVINGETVIAKYSTNATSKSALGEYDITSVVIQYKDIGADHGNYIGSIYVSDCLDKVKIVKRPVTIVYYNYEGLIYNGKSRNIGVYALDNLTNNVVRDINFNLVCDEGTIKDAKTYHLRAYFDNENYIATNSNLLVFSIEKAVMDLSNIKLNDSRVKLDFKKHSIEIEGELPEGVSVVYTIDGKEGNSTASAFSHAVTATFVIDRQNYLPVDGLEATLYIDMSWVFITISTVIILIGIAICLALLYVKYRREHPKKIKLKIHKIVHEDLEAKRVASSVEEVLGDKKVEIEEIENEDDLLDDSQLEKSFIDKIYAAGSELKYYYSEVKNELLSYEGVSHSVDRKFEVFYHGTRQIAKLSICNNVLKLYVNLDPEKYDKNEYNHKDMSNFECHARTPLRIDVNTTESLRHAKVFIRILRKKEKLTTASNFVRIDYERFYTLRENVFPKLVKKMFNSGKKRK